LGEKVAEAGAGVVMEVENKRLNEGEETVSAEEMVDMEESEMRETGLDVRYIEWAEVVFAAACHGADLARDHNPAIPPPYPRTWTTTSSYPGPNPGSQTHP
jgi:hypothetical protein